jgi:glyoxylase-like metal-dependent hydrolase (beta-lactamase superfamily II)
MKALSGLKTWTTRKGTRIIRVLAGRSNAFLLTNGAKTILVDTGIRMCRTLLMNRLKKRISESPDLLILTHSHFDHAANADWIRQKFGAKVIIHRQEASFLENGSLAGISGTCFLSRLLVKCLISPASLLIKYKPCRFDQLIDEQMSLKDFGFNALILHTPGHTSGSVSIVVDDEIALVGDTMFGIFPGSALPPFAMDVQLLLQSWERLLKTGCAWFLPSHGSDVSRQLVEKEYNKLRKA